LTDWYVDSAAVGTNAGTSKANAWTDMNTGLGGTVQNGDRIFVNSTSVCNYTAETQFSAPGSGNQAIVLLISCSFAGSTPPVDADYTFGATFQTTGTGSRNLKWNNNWYIKGCKLIAGITATDTAQIRIGNGFNATQIYEDCQFELDATGAASISMNESGTSDITLIRPLFKFTQTTHFITQLGQIFINGGSWISGSSAPTNLFTNDNSGNSGGIARIIGHDFTNISGFNFTGDVQKALEIYCHQCKMPASFGYSSASPPGFPQHIKIALASCSQSGNTLPSIYRLGSVGSHTDDTVVTLTGSFAATADGSTPYSRRYDSLANNSFLSPLQGIPIPVWSNTAGVSLTVKFKGLFNGAALPTNADVWVNATYMGNSGDPLATFATSRKGLLTASGTAWVANTTDPWTATLRVNSQVYSAGDVISVSTAPAGMVFYCTVGGTALSSIPAGYATATDGSSVTDSGATFRAMYRFDMSITFTPNKAGIITCTPVFATATSRVYINPVETS